MRQMHKKTGLFLGNTDCFWQNKYRVVTKMCKNEHFLRKKKIFENFLFFYNSCVPLCFNVFCSTVCDDLTDFGGLIGKSMKQEKKSTYLYRACLASAISDGLWKMRGVSKGTSFDTLRVIGKQVGGYRNLRHRICLWELRAVSCMKPISINDLRVQARLFQKSNYRNETVFF